LDIPDAKEMLEVFTTRSAWFDKFLFIVSTYAKFRRTWRRKMIAFNCPFLWYLYFCSPSFCQGSGWGLG
jgi:hypothetical protein